LLRSTRCRKPYGTQWRASSLLQFTVGGADPDGIVTLLAAARRPELPASTPGFSAGFPGSVSQEIIPSRWNQDSHNHRCDRSPDPC
jgi:hypothetical protein